MGLKQFFKENREARKENREKLSWWHRKKHYYDDATVGDTSWSTPIDTMEIKDIDEVAWKAANPALGLNMKFDPTILDRYDTVPSYEIPHAMIALKGTPTNNVRTALEYMKKRKN